MKLETVLFIFTLLAFAFIVSFYIQPSYSVPFHGTDKEKSRQQFGSAASTDDSGGTTPKHDDSPSSAITFINLNKFHHFVSFPLLLIFLKRLIGFVLSIY
jgi:hypothetical protein